MSDHSSELPEREFFRLKETLRDMSIPLLHTLAEQYGIEVPIDAVDIFSVVDAFVDGLSLEGQKKILAEYGDAGREIHIHFHIKEKNSANSGCLFQS